MSSAGQDPTDYLSSLVGSPITVTSAYRTPQHNAAVGGVPNSAHLTPGQAFDFVPKGMSTTDAAQKIAQSGVPFDQVIDEGNHVHVSFAPANRRQVLGQSQPQMTTTNQIDAEIQAAASQAAPPPVPSPSANASTGAVSPYTVDAEIQAAAKAPSVGGTIRNLPAPSIPKQPFGFTEQLGASLPFGKDIIAGGGAALDYATGRLNSSFGDQYQANLNQLNDQQADYSKQNPLSSMGATATGLLMAGKPTSGAISQIPSLPGKILAGIKAGATLGGLYGVGEAGPLSDRPKNALVGAGAGAITGGVLPVTGAVLKPVARALGATAGAIGEKLGLTVPDYVKQAENKLLAAMGRDSTTPGGVAPTLSANGKPLSIMDVAGTNTKRLARNLVTQPGQAGDAVTTFLQDRSEDQTGRVLGDIGKHLSNNTDVYGVADNLSKQRAAAAAPLYEEAFAGGSTAPLADQFRSQLQAATGAKGTIASQIRLIEQNSPGSLAARGAAGADTRAKYMALQTQLQEAEQTRQTAAAVFQKAQTDGSANAPGAVWSPRIQQFIDDPIVKQGITKGLEVQRLEALAAGKTFNPTEYSVVGTNPDGTPKIGSVPNMRLLDAGKRGLDDILESYRDGTTGKLNLDQRGRAIDQVRKALISELDTINPKYKAARAAWAGPSQSNSAMQMGENSLTADPEQIDQAMGRLSDSDKDFYRIGAARAIQDKANSAADSADLSKRLFGNARVRAQIEKIFGKGSADAFGQAMGAEGNMAETKRFVLGGSNTANKVADALDSHQELAQDIMHGVLHGGPTSAVVMPTIKALGRGINNLFTGMHPEVANHLANALTATGPSATAIYEKLAAEQAARHAALLRSQGLGLGINRLAAGAAGSAGASTYSSQ